MVLLQPVDNVRELIVQDQAIAVRTVKVDAVIAVVGNGRKPLRQPCNVTAATKNPQAFHEVEERVGVARCVEQDAFSRALVRGHDGHGVLPPALTARMCDNKFVVLGTLAEVHHAYAVGFVNVTTDQREHGQ